MSKEEDLVTMTIEIHNVVMSLERFERFIAQAKEAVNTGKPTTTSINFPKVTLIHVGMEPRHILKLDNEPPILERSSGRARLILRNTNTLSDDQDLVIKAQGAHGNVPDNQIN